MSRLSRVRQWARENRDPSILEVLRQTRWWPLVAVASGPLLAALVFALAAPLDSSVLSSDAKKMLAVFALAGAYWVTGAIPPFATGILVIGLGVFLLGIPAEAGALLHDARTDITGWQQFIAPVASPVIVLMLGGFVLGQAAHKHGIDRVMAVTFLRPFGTRPSVVLLGLMLVTANFSMWMSNTATAALMVTLVAPLLAQIDPKSPMRKSFALAIPIAANIGGIGTPIGTPPNAIAFAALHTAGIEISFVGWMVFGVPVVVVMLLIAWAYLMLAYRPDSARLELRWGGHIPRPGLKQWVVYGTFTVTVGLWVTSIWSGLPIAVVALIPIVVFTTTRLIDRYDFNSLDWDILLLMGGGLALGAGMQDSGLAAWLVGQLPLSGLGETALVAVFCLSTLALSTFMSNTAVANLLMPIALGLALSGGPGGGPLGVSPASVGVAVALGASLAMALPVSTPPNAIAFAAGHFRVPHMVRAGLVVGICGTAVVTVLCRVFVV